MYVQLTTKYFLRREGTALEVKGRLKKCERGLEGRLKNFWWESDRDFFFEPDLNFSLQIGS